MKIAGHLRKIERLETIRTVLDRRNDCEMWYWATLNASMHAINAALHRLKVTVAEDCFAHNVPVYYRAVGGRWKPVVRPFGDLEHVDTPELEALLPRQLKRAGRAVRRMEKVREPILRGTMLPTKTELDTVEKAFRECLDVCRGIVAGTRGGSK
jgi:hypothetical protein